jgi:gamma-butyrobetaine dioxygenase
MLQPVQEVSVFSFKQPFQIYCHPSFVISLSFYRLDHNQKIRRFTYNNHVRDYHLSSPPEKVCDLYRAYMMLGQMMRDPKNKIDYKLKPGEVVTFNNSRVLHGRTEYTPTETGSRHLQGTYLDWDLINARLGNLLVGHFMNNQISRNIVIEI